MKAKVTINGKEHEITLTDEQIKQVNNTWIDEYNRFFEKDITSLSGEGTISIGSLYTGEFFSCFPSTNTRGEIFSKIKLLIEMTQFALLRNNGWKADWTNMHQANGICCQNKKAFCDYRKGRNDLIFGISVKSNEIAEEMLSIFKEDIERFY